MMVRRTLILLYGLLCYGLFLVTFLYGIGFVGGFGTPTTLDGPRSSSLPIALAVDLALLAVFAVQHSGMARPAFKRWLTRFIPQPAERSTYVLLSSVALLALFVLWQPLGGSIWETTGSIRIGMTALFAFGWLAVLVTTFLINHFDLFGLRQVWLCFRGHPYSPLPFRTPGPYRFVRHPLYIGWMIAFWAAPTMSAAHLLFAVVTTGYMLIAIVFEERDLVNTLPEYRDYQQQVPRLIPRIAILGKPAASRRVAPAG